MSKTFIFGPRLFDGEQFLDDHGVLVEEGQVLAVLPRQAIDLNDAGIHHHELKGGLLAPGFIDLQVNGGGDVLFNSSPSVEGLQAIAQAHRGFGCTAWLPTVISDSNQVMRQAARAVNAALATEQAGVLGIHFEGPAFSPARNGAHRAEYLRPLAEEELAIITSLKRGKTLLTFSPEVVSTVQITDLAAQGIQLSIGHSASSYAQSEAALTAGASCFTHLFNAMPAISNRAPGPALAALNCPDSFCGIIVDGHHVHPAMVSLALRSKPRGKLFLVSDAMPVVGGGNSFSLYGESLQLEDSANRPGRLVNSAGNLAGTAIGMIDAVRELIRSTDASLQEALRMASLYPADYLGLGESYGRIKTGYRADLVHLGDQLQVLNSWVAGSDHDHPRAIV